MLPDTTLQLKPWLVLKRFGEGKLLEQTIDRGGISFFFYVIYIISHIKKPIIYTKPQLY